MAADCIVGAARAPGVLIQFALHPINDPIDTLGHFSDQSRGLRGSLRPGGQATAHDPQEGSARRWRQ